MQHADGSTVVNRSLVTIIVNFCHEDACNLRIGIGTECAGFSEGRGAQINSFITCDGNRAAERNKIHRET